VKIGPLSYVFENQVGQFFLRVIVGAEDEVVVATDELMQKAFSLNH
jgi:hypothetical protein